MRHEIRHKLGQNSTPFAREPQIPCAHTVRHYCPGGREHGGGIGRMAGYILDAAQRRGQNHLVQDTRGPAFAPLHSSLRLMISVGELIRDRLTTPERIHHLHIAGRGSTLRKLVLARVAQALGSRWLLHLHDYDYASDFASRPKWLQQQIRKMFMAAPQVVVLGQRDRTLLTEVLGVAPERISVLPNAVPDPGPQLRQARGLVTILFLGRLSARKGVPELLGALATPTLRGLPWKAVLAGDGPLEDYRHQAVQGGTANRVSLPGWLGAAQISALCREADILVLPSHAEGLAMAVLEGMAHGLTVITTRVGAHEEVITDQSSGLFVPVGNTQALARSLALAVEDPDLRLRLGQEARRVYLARYSIAAYLNQLESLYQRLSQGRPIKSAVI